MRHRIPLAICTVAAIALAPVAVAAHHGAMHQQVVKSAQSAAVEAKKVKTAFVEHQTLQHQVNTLMDRLDKSHKNCLLGANAYNNLTSFSKSHLAKPDCSV